MTDSTDTTQTDYANAVNFSIRLVANLSEVADWSIGTSTGGPNSDGRYPFTMADGTTKYVPCPAKIAQLENGGSFVASVGTFHGALSASEQLEPLAFSAAATLPANMEARGAAPASIATVDFAGAPATTFVLTLNRKRSDQTEVIGTIQVSSDGSVDLATTDGKDIDFAIGDVLIPSGPSDEVPTMLGLGVALVFIQ